MKNREHAMSDDNLASQPDPDGDRGVSTTAGGRRPGGMIIVVVPFLLVLITFLFWYGTWFGRPLTDKEMQTYLTDTSVSHKTQHTLSQLAERIARGDTAARRWYPQIERLADNKEPQLRSMAAWVMGQDSQSQEFHQVLRKLVADPEPLVRWNAALALVRFGDAVGEPQLRLMMRPYALLAPQAGTINFRVKEQDPVRTGSLIARVRASDAAEPTDVRSPLAGQVERRVTKDEAKVAAGDEIAILSPAEDQVWESLRALYLVGQSDDLEDVERFARGVPGMSERVRQQAALTAQAIRQRASSTAPSDK